MSTSKKKNTKKNTPKDIQSQDIITKKEDVLSEVTELIQAPSQNTKRKILFSINVTFFIAVVALIIYLIKSLGGLPAPERDIPVYTLALTIMGLSAIHNGFMLFFFKKRTKVSNIIDSVTAWASYSILQLIAWGIVHSSPNTGISILVDFALSMVVIFIAGTVLNRWVALASFVIACTSLLLGFVNRGTEFVYHILPMKEVNALMTQVGAQNPEALQLFQSRIVDQLAPIPLGLAVSVWLAFLVFAFSAIFFETSMLGQILRVIPTAISKINTAAEQKQKLEGENTRMGLELDVAKDIQTMVLPTKEEINNCKGLDVAARMDTASEVGGDFYEVLPQKDGATFFGIGDVTDHGLQSGVVMLMTQTAYRTALVSSLSKKKKVNLQDAISAINSVVYENVQTRLADIRNLTLSLIEYRKGKVSVTGQHETFLLKKKNSKKIENISTTDLGLYVGMTAEIDSFTSLKTVAFNKGDTLLFYTDGVTEAENKKGEQYDIDRLIKAFDANSKLSSADIIKNIYKDIYKFIAGMEVLDDITMLVVKRLS